MSNIMKSHDVGANPYEHRIPHSDRRHKRSAFTLIELLVVIGIVALLAMLTFPSLRSVFGVARSTQCSNRLKKIAEAVELARAQEGRDEIHGMVWQSVLSKYLGGDKSAMICPEYAYLLSMRLAEGEEEEEKRMPLGDLVQFKVDNNRGGVWYEDLERGPMVAKLSDENFHLARGAGWLTERADHFPRQKYEDGSEEQSRAYWLCLEDYGNDWDMKDVMVKVTLTPSGYVLEPESGSTGHRNSIMDKLTGELLTHVKSRTARGALDPIPISTAGVVSSYGMNSMAPNILDTPGAILVLDYHWVMAAPQDIWSDYPNVNNSSIPSFARHREGINVLFVGGSVKMMNPYHIDPQRSDARQTFWMP
ncbi:MAG: type II secretion system protein [Phycisphaerae bacterium]|jgi:prepilin-type N-terminal cleavage/methylation domain-containing protein/prepilin-type processing-associated H-X9-DG protein|nr:type II secretion system protein [Phycisphaerae bacterium]